MVLYDGQFSKLYINGVLDKSVATNGANLKQNGLEGLIGGETASHSGGGSASAFDGIIDDVKIYNYALSQSEITALYNEPAPCQTNKLIAHYPFCGNANNATTVPGLNGTVIGATLTTDRFGNANSAYRFAGSISHDQGEMWVRMLVGL